MTKTIPIEYEDTFFIFSGVFTANELYIGNKLFAKLKATKVVETDFIIVNIFDVAEGHSKSSKDTLVDIQPDELLTSGANENSSVPKMQSWRKRTRTKIIIEKKSARETQWSS